MLLITMGVKVPWLLEEFDMAVEAVLGVGRKESSRMLQLEVPVRQDRF